MKRNRVLDYAAYLVVRTVICCIQAVPLEICAGCCQGLALLMTDVVPMRRKVIEENLRNAFPDWTPRQRRRLTRDMWRHLLLLVVEAAQAPRRIDVTNWTRFARIRHDRVILKALYDKRPLILVTGHYGNFEISSYLLGLWGFPTISIARPLDNPYLHEYVTKFRRLRGHRLLPKQGCAPEVAAVLDSGGTLGILADQSAGPKGCWVEFFGRPASTHKAIALFALQHDALLILTYARRGHRPLQYEVGAESILDPRELRDDPRAVVTITQWYTQGLERIIRKAPEQYWWIHRRWKDNRPERHRGKLAA